MKDKGLHIKYKNGDEQWFDPILDFEETAVFLAFWCGGYEYNEILDDVEFWRFYDLCDVCKFDIDYCRCDAIKQ